ncbi:hypothetical protein GCM10023224_08270 [Streptomonospora halophila]|uniref:Uncharacterized protein n=1 Tax=Streptomonospora halophila TaxID=427369 RepID=A0ABP9GDN5_9ACTN
MFRSKPGSPIDQRPSSPSLIVSPAYSHWRREARTETITRRTAVLAYGPIPLGAFRGYILTGLESLTAREQAQILAETLGRRVEFAAPAPEEYARTSIENGTPAASAAALQDLHELFRAHRAGVGASTTPMRSAAPAQCPAARKAVVRRRTAEATAPRAFATADGPSRRIPCGPAPRPGGRVRTRVRRAQPAGGWSPLPPRWGWHHAEQARVRARSRTGPSLTCWLCQPRRVALPPTSSTSSPRSRSRWSGSSYSS